MVYLDKMSEEVKTEFNRCVTHISRIDGVVRIYLFGSYAHGEPTTDSDIDLYIIVKDEVDVKKLLYRINLELSERYVALDVLADTESEFKVLSAPDRVTMQREIKDKGVVVYGK